MDRTKKIITVTLLIAMISSFAVGCSNELAPSNNKTTTPEIITTTEEPTTTQEVTTEETTTSYRYKGESFVVPSSKKEIFMDLVVEKGWKVALNDIVGKDEGDDADRGRVGRYLIFALYKRNHIDKVNEFEYTYWEPGYDVLEISYDQNVIIEYNEEEKMYFQFVKEGNGMVAFDVYEIE